MPGNYTVTQRPDGFNVNGQFYTADHQQHVDNLEPPKVDDYSLSLPQMQGMTDPGELGSESLATPLAGPCPGWWGPGTSSPRPGARPRRGGSSATDCKCRARPTLRSSRPSGCPTGRAMLLARLRCQICAAGCRSAWGKAPGSQWSGLAASSWGLRSTA